MDTNENLSWLERTEQLISEAEKTGEPLGASGESRVNGLTLSRFIEIAEQVEIERSDNGQKLLKEHLWNAFELTMVQLGHIAFTPPLHHRPEVQEFFRRFALLAYADRRFDLDAQEVYRFIWLCEDVQEIGQSFDRLRKKT